MEKMINYNNERRLLRVGSEFICIKPRGNKKELLINICLSSQVLMTYKYIVSYAKRINER